MSDIEEAIRDKLLNDANVSALVGTRIYSSELPQKPTYPALIYERVDSERDFTMEGPSGFVESTFQIRVYAESYQEAKDLSNKTRQALNGLSEIVLGVRIHAIFLQSDSDEFDDDLEINSAILDFTVNHDETL